MLPEGWKEKKISDILERVKDPVIPEVKQYYLQIGIRSHGKGIFHKEPVTGQSLGNKRVFNIHPDCFIVNIVFAWEQAVAKTSDAELGMIASHRFPMYKPKNDQCDIDFMLYYFKTPLGKYKLGLASPGGAGRNKTLGQSEFSKLELIIPPINEQRKIAEIIFTWDKAIETVEKLIENSKQQKKALMQQLLTGKKRFLGFEENFSRYHFSNIVEIDKKSLGSKTPDDFTFSYISLSDVGTGYISENLSIHKFKNAPSRARELYKMEIYYLLQSAQIYKVFLELQINMKGT